MKNNTPIFMTRMKYIIISLLISCFGHLTLSGQPYNMVLEESYNNCLNQTDSVLRENIYSNRFEKIRVVHTKKESLKGLKQTEIWEAKEYATRQKSIFKKMEHDIIKQIPIPILNEALKYKSGPITCKLTIAPHDGVVKEVSFLMEYEISSDFTNKDILNFENIILNTKFTPEPLINGDIVVYYWPIHYQSIKKYLDCASADL